MQLASGGLGALSGDLIEELLGLDDTYARVC
jgi:hypothetical protein